MYFSATSMWAFFGAVEAGFVIFFGLFAVSLEKRMMRTFYTRLTAKQFNVKLFCEATDDIARLSIFSCHPSYYRSIRGEIKEWVSESYGTWIEEKPAFFTERIKSQIPLDMIPMEYLDMNKPVEMNKRRRAKKAAANESTTKE